jgi:hypothetical protein
MEDTDKTFENITTSNMCGNHKSLYGDGQQYHQYNKKVEIKKNRKSVSNEIVMGITKHSWKHFKHLQQELTKFKQSKKQTKKAKIKNKTKQRNMRVETGQ